MSRLVKTPAIVVRHTPHSETSRIIHWLTRDHGRITTLAKGAMRPRNAYLGQFDRFYTAELIYYGRDRDTVFVTREISAVHTRDRLRKDWRAMIAAGYITDLTYRVTPQHEPVPHIYALLAAALDAFTLHGWHPPLLYLFELRLLGVLGLSPRFDSCAVCGKALTPGLASAFTSQHGGVACRDCRQRIPGSVMTAGPDTVAILTNWQRSSGFDAAKTARCTEEQVRNIRHVIGDFLAYHLELFPGDRDAALNLLAGDPQPA